MEFLTASKGRKDLCKSSGPLPSKEFKRTPEKAAVMHVSGRGGQAQGQVMDTGEPLHLLTCGNRPELHFQLCPQRALLLLSEPPHA